MSHRGATFRLDDEHRASPRELDEVRAVRPGERLALSTGTEKRANQQLKAAPGRATLEATAYQSREVVEAMNADSGVDLESLKVDGGMVQNDLLMQFQADLLGVPVIRPVVAETTALGAAYAAGLATGFWESEDDLRENWAEDMRWEPTMDSSQSDEYFTYWKKAVTRTFDWFD